MKMLIIHNPVARETSARRPGFVLFSSARRPYETSSGCPQGRPNETRTPSEYDIDSEEVERRVAASIVTPTPSTEI
ncbi:hypothetical protein B566_EDAN011178 [Ephemera danica]|nr:hypothetical protein B566_EDAN011178 [Ephemera danica]